MNWLAHIFVSKNSIHFRLGNLLADTLKGRTWVGAPDAFTAGIERHRAIDRFTDEDPDFLVSKSRLGESGFLRGIVVDMLYDHFLSKNWRQFSKEDLDGYLERFYREAHSVLPVFPEQSQAFVQGLIRSKRLESYREFCGIESAARQMDRRLSERLRKRETLTSYLPAAKGELVELENDFMRFFPRLLQHFEEVKVIGSGSIDT